MSMRTPASNVLLELQLLDAEYSLRGDQFAGSHDERLYAAVLLGHAIRHTTGADAATEGGTWPAYAATATAVRPALEMFPPPLRLAIGGAAHPKAGL